MELGELIELLPAEGFDVSLTGFEAPEIDLLLADMAPSRHRRAVMPNASPPWRWSSRADRPVAVTLGTDKGYDAADFVNELRSMNVRPHVAQNTTRRRGRSAVDGRTTRHASYATSQRMQKRIEEAFGWMKTVGGMRRPIVRGTDRVGWAFTFSATAYNLVRLPKLVERTAWSSWSELDRLRPRNMIIDHHHKRPPEAPRIGLAPYILQQPARGQNYVNSPQVSTHWENKAAVGMMDISSS
jgi:Transposase DDE domain